MPRDGELDDPLDQVVVLDPGGARRGRELVGLLEVRAGVDLEDVDLAALGHAQVDAAVVAHAERAEGVERDPLEPGADVVGQRRDHG